MSFPLSGTIQNSYRAELRALYAVVHTATVPTCVVIDCKAVADMFHFLIQGCPIAPAACQDLWGPIADAVATAPYRLLQSRLDPWSP